MSLFQYTLPLVKQARQLAFEQFFIVTQIFPNNPYLVVRPHFNGGSRPIEPKTPREIYQALEDKQAAGRVRKFLDGYAESPYRVTQALLLNLNQGLTPEARDKVSRTLPHITQLYEKARWPQNMGIVFPEALSIIGYQTKKLWLPEPLKNEKVLVGTWKRYDFPEYIEYVRLK